jgi:hypothetical protein
MMGGRQLDCKFKVSWVMRSLQFDNEFHAHHTSLGEQIP